MINDTQNYQSNYDVKRRLTIKHVAQRLHVEFRK